MAVLFSRYTKELAKDFVKYDRRCKFYDLSKIEPDRRKANYPILCIYSAFDNIGNYLPLLGISKMIPFKTDAWNIHDKRIDFNFINEYYKGIIIAGAGLLHGCFEHFWKRIPHECKLPIVVWGVGVCLPDKKPNSAVKKDIAMKVFKKCDLINVRDRLTRDYYNLENANVTPCPTVVYLKDYIEKVSRSSQTILFSSHEQLLSISEIVRIKNKIANFTKNFEYTNNIQNIFLGLNDIILRFYCKSYLVVSTRLHGAIIARGLGIPYIAIPRDEKVRAFCREYSGGIMIEDIDELESVLINENLALVKPINTDSILRFGEKVCNWIRTI